jgi:hypothetical protein
MEKQKRIVAFPLQQWLRESPTNVRVRHTYIAYLAICCKYPVAEVSVLRPLL